MQLSLSVRIAEGFLTKERPVMGLEEVAGLARRAGYDAICMRASQVGVHSPKEDVDRARQILAEYGLPVSMVTGDFDVVYNNERGPEGLRRIGEVLELARALAAPLVRVALKRDEEIRWAQRAADQAADVGVALVHQCHALSLFETVAGIEQTLAKINRPNFGLIFEPANLELCGQDYGPETIKRLRPWIFNVYLQNHVINPTGSTTLETWCRGPVRFDLLPIHQSGGIALDRVADGLEQTGYDGTVTAHESAPPGSPPADCAVRAAQFLRERFSRLTSE